LQAVGQLVAEDRGRFEEYAGLLGLTGQRVRLPEQRGRVGLEVVTLEVEARQRRQHRGLGRRDIECGFEGLQRALGIVEVIGLELCLLEIQGRDERRVTVGGAQGDHPLFENAQGFM